MLKNKKIFTRVIALICALAILSTVFISIIIGLKAVL